MLLIARTIEVSLPFDFGMMFYGGQALLWDYIVQSQYGAEFLCKHLSRQNSELVLGLMCCLAHNMLSNLAHMPFAFARTFGIEKPYGLSEAGPLEFLISRAMMVLEHVLVVLPVTAFVVKVIEFSGEHLLVSFFFGTALIEYVIIYLYPHLIMPLFAKYEPMKKSHPELH